jgi:DNA-binding transcriptional ArsR family regulator
MVDSDAVFKALADPTRRRILDLLRERNGQSLSDLEVEVTRHVEMTRFGVMKHLKVLVAAGLVTTERSGRHTLHYLNPVPIRLIHDRWIAKYAEGRVAALSDLKTRLESS